MKINNNHDAQRIDPSWLHCERFPKTSKYELDWALANEMGPNVLWLTEELLTKLHVEPGSRVLDMGCGRALSSIFLAKELGVQVWANDLWVSADDNWSRIVEARVEDSVFPVRAEAHALPYAAGFFDAVVSVDAYQYFGTDDTYLGYITRFVRPGGRLGLVMPCLKRELDGDPPEHLTRTRESGNAFWDPSECWCFHTLEWWRRHLERSRLVGIETAEYVEDGWKLWRDWELIRNGGGHTGFPSEAPTLEEDGGEYLGFVLVVARRLGEASNRPFDHPLLIRL